MRILAVRNPRRDPPDAARTNVLSLSMTLCTRARLEERKKHHGSHR